MNEKGFTLIELLIVIAIIGLLATFSVVNFTNSRQKAKMANASSFAHSLYAAQGAEAIGVWNLDEGNGATVVYNSSGASTAAGTITGATWITDGPNGKNALSFTSGSQVSLGTVTIPQRVTVAAWIRTSSAAQQPFFSNRTTSGLYLGTNAGRLFQYFNTATPPAMATVATINDNQWHFVAWSSDGTTSIMYIDGKKENSISQVRSLYAGVAFIGFDPPNGEYFNGSISQLGVYSDMYSARQIEQLYAEQKSAYLVRE